MKIEKNMRVIVIRMTMKSIRMSLSNTFGKSQALMESISQEKPVKILDLKNAVGFPIIL